MLALVSAFSAFAAVAAFVLYLSGVGASQVETRLGALRQSSTQAALDAPFSDRIVVPVFGLVAKLLIEFLPHSFINRVSSQLLAAGKPMTTQAFFTLVAIIGIFLPLAVILFAAFTGSVTAVAMVVAVVIAVIGVFLTFMWLRRRVRNRRLAIWKSLPDAFDLITVSVEAGLGLDAALRHVSDKLRGPLSDEISQMLREVGMGRARREALEDLAERVGVEELTIFVNSVIQAEQLGTSLARVLRAQGITIRTRRRQRAEEMARRAPVKMVFPLVFFIMPTFFIVTLGPIAIRLLSYLSE